MDDATRLLSVEEVARVCNVDEAAVIEWVERHSIHAFARTDGAYEIDPLHLIEFLLWQGRPIPSELRRPWPQRILVVDDDDLARGLIKRMLASKRAPLCRLEEARNGLEACVLLPIFKPHLVLLDVFMPDLGGEDVCHLVKINGQYRATKILIITGFPDDARARRALRDGADGLLAKPFTHDELFGKLQTILKEEIAAQRAAAPEHPVPTQEASQQ